jgi:hypothetical protein
MWRQGVRFRVKQVKPEGKGGPVTHLRAWILRICALPSLSGKENSTLLSNRPGRNRAGSSVSGLIRVKTEN